MRINYKTRSGEIAAEIEKGIRSGVFAPGSRLPALRDLAAAFGVSTQAVKWAVRILDEKNLVVSRPRIGLFVNPDGILAGAKRLFLLAKSDGMYTAGNYLQRALCLGDHRLYANCHIQQRTFPGGALEKIAFQYELQQIAQEKPDCLVILTERLSLREARATEKLPFPVLFLGDFQEGLLPGFARDQIFERTEERGRDFVEAAWRAGGRDFCLIASSPAVCHVQKLIAGAEACAKEHGVSLRFHRMKQIDLNDAALTRKSWKINLDRIFSSGIPDTLIVDGFERIDLLAEVLREQGMPPGDRINIVNDIELCPGTIYVKTDYLAFASCVADTIRRALDGEPYHCGVLEVSGRIRRTPLFLSDALHPKGI